jgi:hydroxymethylpyrimidine pyrophosphatase-like HAD family hydrolase
MPLITYNGSFIIDGHHRWSQLFAFNPMAKIEVLNITGHVSPLAFLKVVQGSIAASLLDNDPDKKNVQLPIAEVKPGLNILKMDDKELEKNVAKRITDKAVDELMLQNDDLKDKEECIKYIAANCGILRDNNKPIGGAPTRPYMPQTDKVAPRPEDDISPELKERIINTIKLK